MASAEEKWKDETRGRLLRRTLFAPVTSGTRTLSRLTNHSTMASHWSRVRVPDVIGAESALQEPNKSLTVDPEG
jgi:hypothetical protein